MNKEFRSRDLQESISAVSSIYCPHELLLSPRESRIDTRLAVHSAGRDAVVELAYGAKVEVDAGKLPDLYLFMQCTRGHGIVSQKRSRMAWLPNTVLPVSANLNTQFLFEANFEQVSLPVDGNFLTSMLTRLLGYAPSSAIQFRLSPIPEVFQPTWHEIINLKCRLPDDAPMAARTALQEFVALSLLTWLPHNFSELLKRPPGAVTESKTVRLLRDADDYIMQNQSDSALTVSEVAAKVGVGVRSLEQIFRIHKQTTPQAYIRSLRLQAVRQILQENPSPDSLSISQIAMENGFFHLGRFAHYYKNSFGESPRQTVAKRRNRD